MKRILTIVLALFLILNNAMIIRAEEETSDPGESPYEVSETQEASSQEEESEPIDIYEEDTILNEEGQDLSYAEETPETDSITGQNEPGLPVDQLTGTEGNAYAILTDEGELIFFRSDDYYENGSSEIVSINGLSYDGTIYSGIESLDINDFDLLDSLPWGSGRDKYYIKSVSVAAGYKIRPISTARWFYDCYNITSFDSTGFDTSNVTDMSYMFAGCSSLATLDLNSFDTSNVVNMSAMFKKCSSLSSIDLGNFNTSRVTNLASMFQNCSSLASLDLNSFNTQNVTDMYCMFVNCPSLISLNIGCFDTSKVTSMDGMFINCPSLTIIDLGPEFTVWRDNSYLPEGTWVNTEKDLLKTETELYIGYPSNASSWAGRWTKFDLTGSSAYAVLTDDGDLIFFRSYEMYENETTQVVTDIYNNEYSGIVYDDSHFCWAGNNRIKKAYVADNQTIKPGNINAMFSGCRKLESFDGTGFDTSQVTQMGSMFDTCTSLKFVDVSGFDTSSVTEMGGMFYRCSSLAAIDLSSFDTSNVQHMGELFGDIGGRLSKVVLGAGWTKWIDDARLPSGIWTNKELGISKTASDLMNEYPEHASEWAGSWERDISKNGRAYAVLTEEGDLVFFRSFDYYEDSDDTYEDIYGNEYTGTVYSDFENVDLNTIEDWPWVENNSSIKKVYVAGDQIIHPISMAGWFYGCNNLSSFDATGFDTSNVTQMGEMFWGCTSLEYIDISDFDTSSVSGMTQMFNRCSSLSAINLSGIDTSNLKYMSHMFGGCTSLASIDLSSFDTSNVEHMHGVFYNCSSLTSLDLSNFNTSKVIYMCDLFFGCSSLTSLDLSGFDTSNVTDVSFMFGDCSSLTSLDLSSFDTSNVTDMSGMFSGCNSLLSIKLGIRWNKWIDDSYLPAGLWSNGAIEKTEEELYNEYPSHASEWAGTWTKEITPTNSIAYAVLTADGDLIFFRSFETYTNNTSTTVKDIYNNTYTGTVYTEIETSRYVMNGTPWYSERNSIKRAYAAPNQIITPANTAWWFYPCSNLASFDASGFDTSNAREMQCMFQNCSSLTSLDLRGFDTSSAISMSAVFGHCTSLVSLDISSFDTSNVTNMSGMFNDCPLLTSLDLNSFNTERVTNMSTMFYGCSSLTSLDLSSFNTSNVTNMANMFYGCNSLLSIKLGIRWNKWIDDSYLPAGLWSNGAIEKTEEELYNEYPSHASEWAGEWERTVLATGSCGDNVTYTIYPDYSMVISGTGPMNDFNDSAIGFVSRYGDYSTKLTSVTIEDRVTSIGVYEFYRCSSLKSITIPDSVSSIGRNALSDCPSLELIVVSANNPTYDSRDNCNAIIETSSNTLISGCKNTIIPDSVKSIGFSAFSGITSLNAITIPDSVTSIAENAFFNCTALSSLTMPISATMDDNSFEEVSSIQKLHLTKGTGVGVDYTSSSKYYTPWCRSGDNLTEIILDEGITRIGNYTFYNCTGVSSIDIPDSLTGLGWNAFSCCKSLTSVTIPDSLTYVSSGAFECCYSLTSVTIPESVTIIYQYAFSYCPALSSLTMPISATMDDNSFEEVSSIQKLHLTKGTGVGVDYSDTTVTSTPWYRSRNNLTEIILDEGIRSLGEYTFYKCEKISSVDVPDSVTSIGRAVFANCSSLASADIGDSITSIERDGYYGCTSLTSVTIPDSVTSLGQGAFFKCSALESIELSENLESIGIGAFQVCESLKSIDIPETVSEIGYNAFYGCVSLLDISFGHFADDPLAIGNQAFYLDSLKPTNVHVWDKEDIHPSISGYNWSTDNRNVSFQDIDYSGQYGEILPKDIKEYRRLNKPEGIWTSKLHDFIYDPTIKSYVYDTKDIRVYYGTKLLALNVDYTLKYSNNTKAGYENDVKAPSLVVTGKGNYVGKLNKTFNVLPLSISEDDVVVILDKSCLPYAGKVQKAKISSVEYKGIKLKNKTDYSYEYLNPNSIDEGIYTIKVTFKGNYSGETDVFYTIVDSDYVHSISSATISSLKTMTYTGDPLIQTFTVKAGKSALIEDRDYTVSYRNNILPGTAYVFIEGINDYEGTIIKSFKIKGLSISKAVVDGIKDLRFTGKELKQDSMTLSYNGTELIEGTDYTVSYKNNTKAGTATITFTGTGGYAGTLKKSFKINKAFLARHTFTIDESYPYLKGGVKPLPETDLVYNTDYTLSYKNNTKLGTASVTIKGKGNYEGTIEKTFTIIRKGIEEVDIQIPDKVYTGKTNTWKSTPVLTDSNGKKLTAGTDYEKTISYKHNGKELGKNDILQKDDIVTVTITGKGNYEGNIESSYRIVQANLSKATVTIPAQYYTGRPITLLKSQISVRLNKQTLSDLDYDIISYSNNTGKGTAKVTLKGKGNYGGYKTVSFKIKQRSFGMTLHFDTNGATSGTMADLVIYKDTKLPKCSLKKVVDGRTYTFLGWSETAGGELKYRTGNLYDYSIFKAGQIITLYAVWE